MHSRSTKGDSLDTMSSVKRCGIPRTTKVILIAILLNWYICATSRVEYKEAVEKIIYGVNNGKLTNKDNVSKNGAGRSRYGKTSLYSLLTPCHDFDGICLSPMAIQ